MTNQSFEDLICELLKSYNNINLVIFSQHMRNMFEESDSLQHQMPKLQDLQLDILLGEEQVDHINCSSLRKSSFESQLVSRGSRQSKGSKSRRKPNSHTQHTQKSYNNLMALQQEVLQPVKEKDEYSRPDSVKNKKRYINKLKEFPDKLTSKVENQRGEVQFLDKKQKGKLFAKQCRDRKKLYIELMEKQQKKLEEELRYVREDLEKTKTELNVQLAKNRTTSGFTAGRHQLIQKVQNLLGKTQNNVDDELNTLLDSLSYRIGATGKQRLNTLNENYKQIINLSLPALHRYMLWSATESTQMFADHFYTHLSLDQQNEAALVPGFKRQDFSEQFHRVSTLTLEQQGLIKKRYQAGFIAIQRQLWQIISDLKATKRDIDYRCINLQNLTNDVRDILTPRQVASMILWIQEQKYRKEISLEAEDSTPQELSGEPSKRVKM